MSLSTDGTGSVYRHTLPRGKHEPLQQGISGEQGWPVAMQVQLPETQTSFVPHALPHEPQFDRLAFRSKQPPLQQVRLFGHGALLSLQPQRWTTSASMQWPEQHTA